MISAVGDANGHVKIAKADAVVKAHGGILRRCARCRQPQVCTVVLPRRPTVVRVPATRHMWAGPVAQPPASISTTVSSTRMAHCKAVLPARKIKANENCVSTVTKRIQVVATIVCPSAIAMLAAWGGN